MSQMNRELLPAIFERTLSLDRGGSGFSEQALGLWERMADTLDKIAANTSGGFIQGSKQRQPVQAVLTESPRQRRRKRTSSQTHEQTQKRKPARSAIAESRIKGKADKRGPISESKSVQKPQTKSDKKPQQRLRPQLRLKKRAINPVNSAKPKSRAA